nr:unnamed protein product [Callosobruchus analis]
MYEEISEYLNAPTHTEGITYGFDCALLHSSKIKQRLIPNDLTVHATRFSIHTADQQTAASFWSSDISANIPDHADLFSSTHGVVQTHPSLGASRGAGTQKTSSSTYRHLDYRFCHGRYWSELLQIITPKVVRRKNTREPLCAHPYQVEVPIPPTFLFFGGLRLCGINCLEFVSRRLQIAAVHVQCVVIDSRTTKQSLTIAPQRMCESVQGRRTAENMLLSLHVRVLHGAGGDGRCSSELSQITPKAVRTKNTKGALRAQPYQVVVSTPRNSLLQHSLF